MAALRIRKMRRAADHVNTRPLQNALLSEQSSPPGPSASCILVPDRHGLSPGVATVTSYVSMKVLSADTT
jgi:hypothetical protein